MKPFVRLFSFLTVFTSSLFAVERTWIGGTGSWDLPANWSDGVVPGLADVAVIANGSVTADSNVIVSGLRFSGGALSGSGILTVTGSLEWSGGSMSGSGRTILESGATGTYSGPNDKDLGRFFINRGALTWTDGRLLLRSANFENSGVMTVSHEATVVTAGGSPVFDNPGTLVKSGPGLLHFNGVAFNQTGNLNFLAGTILLGGGGANSKTIAVPLGSQLRFGASYSHFPTSTITGPGDVAFENGTHTFLGTYTVAGTTRVSGATVEFNDMTIPQLEISGGNFTGFGVKRITGTLTWTGGAIGGDGKTILDTGASGNFSGESDKDLGGPFENRGSINWDAGRLLFRSGSFLNIGNFTVSHAGIIVTAGGSPFFDNPGTFTKLGANLVQFNGVNFNHSGTLNFTAGAMLLAGGENTSTINIPAGGLLRFKGDYTHQGGSTVTGAGAATFEGGTQSFVGSYSVTGPTTVAGASVSFENSAVMSDLILSSGRLAGNGTTRITGGLQWTGGAMGPGGVTVLNAGATANLSSSNDKDMGRTFENHGTVNLTEGRLLFRESTFSNQGVATLDNNVELVNAGGQPQFVNQGTFFKTGNGIVTINGVVFNQFNIFTLQSGTLNLSGGGQNSQTMFVPENATLRFTQAYTHTPGSTLRVEGTAQFTGGAQNIQGAYQGNGKVLIENATVHFDQNVAVQQVELNSGKLEGANFLQINGALMWRGGALGSPMKVILHAVANATMTTSADKEVQGRFESLGTIIWDNGRLLLRDGTFVNSGPLTIAHDASIVTAGGIPLFDNDGTIHKLSGGLVEFTGVPFRQHGTLNINAGSMLLGDGGENTQIISVPAGTQLRIGNTFQNGAGATISGPGKVSFENGPQTISGTFSPALTEIFNAIVAFESDVALPQLQMQAGVLQGNGTVRVANALVWTGGNMSGGGRTILQAGATSAFTGNADKRIERAFENQGTLTWDLGRLLIGEATFVNSGSVTIPDNGQVISIAAAPVIDNAGTLIKNGAGTLQFSGVILDQHGVLQATGTIETGAGKFQQRGTLRPGSTIGAVTFQGGLPQTTSGITEIDLAAGNNYDQVRVTGEAQLRGALSLKIAPGFVPTDGQKFTVMEFGSRVGSFDSMLGLNINSQFFLEPSLTETNLVFTLRARPQPIFINSRVNASFHPVITLSNIAGQNIVLEAKETVTAPWAPILTNLNSSVVFDFEDGQSANFPARFFRARFVE